MEDGNDIQLQALATVAVAPTTTTLMPAFDLRQFRVQRLSINVINDDGSQTLTTDLQFGPTSTGPWTSSGAMATTFAAGEGVSASVDVGGYAYARLIGSASGAGLNARVGVNFLKRWR